MFVDYLTVNQGGDISANGEVGEVLAGVGYDPGLMRPYWGKDKKGRLRRLVEIDTGQRVYNEKTGQMDPVLREELVENTPSPVANATSLRKDDWIMLDRRVIMATRQRLRAYSDLRNSNTFGGFDGMSKMILEHETVNDVGEAIVDMDGLSESKDQSVQYQLEGLPLPIIHDGFSYSARQLAVSRNSGTPLDTRRGEMAGRRVGEKLENLTIGLTTGPLWATNSEYSRAARIQGYTNFSARQTKTDLTTPNGTNSADIVADILEMRDLMYDANFYGPFILYHSTGYDRYLDDDHFVLETSGMAAPSRTLRDRVRSIEDIQDVRRLDFLTSGFQLVLVSMTSETARAVNGMEVRTIQWETRGGMQLNFRVMTIQAPQLFADFNGNCGIVHGTTS